MCTITVSDDDYISCRFFAEALASRFRYRLVDADILIEQATAWGGNPKKLHRTCQQAPHFVDRFIGSKNTQVLQLRAALAKYVREGNVVCYGIAADLVNIRARQILRMQVRASYESRVKLLQQQMKLNAVDPKVCLDKGECRRERWQKYLYGTHTSAPNEPDLLINLEETGVAETCDLVRHVIEHQSRFRPTNVDLDLIEKWALCTAIRAALAQCPETGQLKIDVTTQGECVVLFAIPPACDEGTFPTRFPASVERSIRTALAQHSVTSQLNPELTIRGDTVKLRGILGRTNEIVGPQPPPARIEAGPSREQANVTSQQDGFNAGQGPVKHLGWRLTVLKGARVLLRPAGVAAVVGVIVVSALFYGSLSSKRELQRPSPAVLLSYTGMITDSICGAGQKRSLPSANCVRACVRSGRAKYALREGGHLIVIDNQQAVEGLAARKVIVTGRLDKRSKEIHVTSVRTVSL